MVVPPADNVVSNIFHDGVVVFRDMGIVAAGAVLDEPILLWNKVWVSRAVVIQKVERAVAEKAVEVCKALMAGKIFTAPIFK